MRITFLILAIVLAIVIFFDFVKSFNDKDGGGVFIYTLFLFIISFFILALTSLPIQTETLKAKTIQIDTVFTTMNNITDTTYIIKYERFD